MILHFDSVLKLLFFLFLFILDHHEDSNEFTTNVSKQIEFVGSCSTLIAERIRNTDSTFLESFPDASQMLLATILIDTYNLDLHSGRTTEQDIFTAEILSTFTDTDTDELFTVIQTGFLSFFFLISKYFQLPSFKIFSR